MDIERFEAISKDKGQKYRLMPISTHIPSPNESDYERGYIERYFVQKANDSESKIFEVDFIGFKKFSKSAFYTTIALDWRIKGTDEQIKESNGKSIQLNYHKMQKLPIYLPNLLQFRKK